MGNADSGHHSDDYGDKDDETYNYHKSVLVEGSTPVKGGPWLSEATSSSGMKLGSRHDRLPDTPVSLDDQEEFVDARQEVDEEGEEEDIRGCEKNDDDDDDDDSANTTSGTLHGSDASGLSLSRSSWSYSGSSRSDKSGSSQHDKSDTSRSSDRSSDRSRDSFNCSISSSGSGSRVSLPNRIRVIDTSDSEGEEEEKPQTSKVSRKLLTSAHKANSTTTTSHKKLVRPVPVLNSPSDLEEGIGNLPVRNQQVKRKADDMDPERKPEAPQMSIPVKKTGGINRLFAQRNTLREMVLGHTSEGPRLKCAKGDNSAVTSSSSKQTSSKTDPQQGTSMEELEENGVSAMEEGESENRASFQHSNTSPFKDVHLRMPSGMVNAAESQNNSKAPQDNHESPSISAVNAGASTSTSAEHQDFDMFEKPLEVSLANNSREIHHRVMPKRGNSVPSEASASSVPQGNSSTHKEPQNKMFVPVPSKTSSESPTLTSDVTTTTLVQKGDKFSFLLSDVLNVHISYEDVTSFRTDVLVNPTDGQLTHANGDAARSIAEATGTQMTNQCHHILEQHGGPLAPAEVVETYACGSLSGRVRHVVHLATPKYEAANEKDTNRKLLTSYLNCLNHVNEKLGLRSIVFPIIGTGSYPQDTCINLFFESLLVHLAERTSGNLKSVTFVVDDIHLGNLAIAMVRDYLEKILLEGIDVQMAEALNSYYGNSSTWECRQNDVNDRLGRQLEVDTTTKLFRGPPIKRPKL